MAEISFIFSAEDPSVAEESLRLGDCLIVNHEYGPDEAPILLTPNEISEVRMHRRFYIVPDESYLSEISLSSGKKRSGRRFKYIMDRVGAASIDLILYRVPASYDVCVGSLTFQARTYSRCGGSLEPRPDSFRKSYKRLCSYIRQSTKPLANARTPKTVHAFPEALALLQVDPSLSPLPTLKIPSSN